MADSLNVDEALARILEQINLLPAETVAIEDSLGRVLAEDIISSLDLPPFDNSSMDGFAILSEDSKGASKEFPVRLRVASDVLAGSISTTVIKAGQAARIMTGAVIPEGVDAIIPVEDTDGDFRLQETPSHVSLYSSVPVGAYIRKRGENISKGQLVIKAGTVIRSAEIAIMASLGNAKIAVRKQPKVVIVGSGDELLELHEAPAHGKIYDSNAYALAAMVEEDGGVALRFPAAKDHPDALRESYQAALAEKPDVIISSAGVSVGAADYVRGILNELGEIGFWRINLRPGKPLAYGHLAGIPFFGLPGNPVSAMVTYTVIVRPSLLKMGGRSSSSRTIEAVAGERMVSDGRRTYARVRLEAKDGQWVAYETGSQSSGAHLSMLLADGLLIIPEEQKIVDKGEKLPVLLLR
jgi:molybdopterin molybdotransferase